VLGSLASSSVLASTCTLQPKFVHIIPSFHSLANTLHSTCSSASCATRVTFSRTLSFTGALGCCAPSHWARRRSSWRKQSQCQYSIAIVGASLCSHSLRSFNYLIALVGSVCFAPLAITLPGMLWLYDFWSFGKSSSPVKQVQFWFHMFLIVLGLFLCGGGTYGTSMEIK